MAVCRSQSRMHLARDSGGWAPGSLTPLATNWLRTQAAQYWLNSPQDACSSLKWVICGVSERCREGDLEDPRGGLGRGALWCSEPWPDIGGTTGKGYSRGAAASQDLSRTLRILGVF